MVDIVIKKNCISFVERKTNRVFYKREDCSEREIKNILNSVGAYKQKQFKFFGKEKWYLPENYVAALKTELF